MFKYISPVQKEKRKFGLSRITVHVSEKEKILDKFYLKNKLHSYPFIYIGLINKGKFIIFVKKKKILNANIDLEIF